MSKAEKIPANGEELKKITVWTKQHENVRKELESTGRYTAKREYVRLDLKEQAPLVLYAYDWLIAHLPKKGFRPEDAEVPVWVSFKQDAAMLQSEGTVILEVEADADSIIHLNIAKWGAVLNYSYIPKDAEDEKRHKEKMKEYGVSDTKAVMSRFYPELKREIIASWDRLFDDSVSMGNDDAYGLIWELRREWIRAGI